MSRLVILVILFEKHSNLSHKGERSVYHEAYIFLKLPIFSENAKVCDNTATGGEYFSKPCMHVRNNIYDYTLILNYEHIEGILFLMIRFAMGLRFIKNKLCWKNYLCESAQKCFR